MRYSLLALAAAAATVSAQDCMASFNTCVASGRAEVLCGCDLARCTGEDNARNRESCSSVSASLATLTSATATAPATYPATSASSSAASTSTISPCLASYNTCVASGRAEVLCGCDLARCTGEDNARNRESCSRVSASLASSASATSSTSATSIITGTAGSQPSGQPPITAPAGSIPLGGTCSEDAQCAGDGVQCWGSNAGIIRACGNFNAGCTRNDQCAYNTCDGGLCRGFLPTESYARAPTASSTSMPTAAPTASSTMMTSVAPTADSTMMPTGTSVTTSTMPAYTGAASAAGFGFAAVAFGFAAWVL